MKDGTLYDAIFSGFNKVGTDVGLLFKMARVLKTAQGAKAPFSGYQPELYVLAADIIQVSFEGRSTAHPIPCHALVPRKYTITD